MENLSFQLCLEKTGWTISNPCYYIDRTLRALTEEELAHRLDAWITLGCNLKNITHRFYLTDLNSYLDAICAFQDIVRDSQDGHIFYEGFVTVNGVVYLRWGS